MDEPLTAIRSQADAILVKPIEFAALGGIIREKLASRVLHKALPVVSVASLLEQHLRATVQRWEILVEHDEELASISLDGESRIGHIPNLLSDLISRILTPQTTKASVSVLAREHGALRRKQGYTATMLIEEYRLLQVSIFNTLQANLRQVTFNALLLGVITIADEMDLQLKQAMLGLVGPDLRDCHVKTG